MTRFNLPFLYSSIKKMIFDVEFAFEIVWPLITSKIKMEISSNFMAFSEYMNFTLKRMRIYLNGI